MKKTILVYPENEQIVHKLMLDINFTEFDRTTVTDPDSEVVIVISFAGDKSQYNENGYVQLVINNISCRFHSIVVPNGHICKTLEEFMKFHNARKPKEIEIKHFDK